MTVDLEPTTVTISGSFKRSKAQIDRDRAIFESRGIKVLSPQRGGLFRPLPGTDWAKDSYPLLIERQMDEVEAKRYHLEAIKVSDYLYIENELFSEEKYGYLGSSVNWELITAMVYKKRIFAREPFDPAADDFDPRWLTMIEHINTMPPEKAADLMKENGKPGGGLYLPEDIIHGRHNCTAYGQINSIYKGIPLVLSSQTVKRQM